MSSSRVMTIVDIAQSVIERAIFPHFLVDPSAAASPRSLWSQILRQKLNHLHVCRAWYHAGRAFLYEDICIQQIDQLPLLMRTLRQNESIRPLLKRSHFIAYIPRCYIVETHTQLVDLFATCPNLYSFSCHAPYLLPSLVMIPVIPFPSSVTHLHLGEQFSTRCLFETLIPIAPSLISLSTVVHLCIPEDIAAVPRLTFSNLTTLALIHRSQARPSAFNIAEITMKWSFPRLENFTIKQNEFNVGQILRFCTMHGSNIAYLSVDPTRYSDPSLDDEETLYHENEISAVLPHCPSLRHIFIGELLHLLPTLPGSLDAIKPHSSLQWIDFGASLGRVSVYIDDSVSRSWEQITDNYKLFPSLKGMRVISSPLRGDPSLSLPLEIPPSEHLSVLAWQWWNDAASEASEASDNELGGSTLCDWFEFEFLQFKVRHTRGRVYEVEPTWPGAGQYTTRDDLTFRPPPGWDQDDSEYLSASESGDLGGGVATVETDTDSDFADMELLPSHDFE